MITAFISQDLWPRLTQAVRASRQRCAVAVAYFGAGAGRLLPLPEGSRLVVNASERAVASGQTCPAELQKLMKRGVAVFSVPNLHAKVFVLGRAAYIGSANASKHSAAQLIEAMVRTTEPGTVRAARQFVQTHSLYQLTPTVLKRLAKVYRPPRIPADKRGRHRGANVAHRPDLPRLFLAQLRLEHWTDRDQRLHDSGLAVAKRRRQRPRSFELDSFRWAGRCPHERGDVVIQVTRQGNGTRLVSPPGNVLHVRTRREATRQVSFVYLERPARRRRLVGSLARSLGRGALKRLRRGGRIRDASFAQALLGIWGK